ncbi:MAG TPA: hypothetical protein VH816_08270 [Gaiellaceae bacterium]
METPELFDFDDPDAEETAEPSQEPRPSRPQLPQLRPAGGIWSAGRRVAWVAGLVLLLSSFMSWYSGSSVEGPTLSVIGWHTGTIGKLVFFLGLVLVVIAILREAAGIELPPTIPESLVTIGLGSLATVLVLIRLISIPDTFAGTSGRSIGLWIALLAALAVIAAGLLRAGEDL